MMNDMMNRQPIPQGIADEVTIEFHFVDGERFTQTLPISHADAAQDVMDWFRNPKELPVWTWRCPDDSKVQMIHRVHLTFIEIRGFIDFNDGRESKWYEKLIDKIKTKWMLR